ncbi:hypothetical protein [Nostoc sp. CMAA1605]|uniref:hypothetical protein n=1 Tax=Nostoc sp. CMAA1605 TaxID=2055159 RepID=UPI001F1CE4F2|nr:hypothetical protein [Nostoc sp. CMAA1605]MCF4967789.1 hypothetical protein [Nostoc sp. CMAA1605]
MTNFSRMSDFIRNSNSISTVLKIAEQSPEVLRTFKLQERGSPEMLANPNWLYEVELPAVFSHISLLLIETLSETQHGQLLISSKDANHETIIELSGHISHRHKLSRKQLQEMQKLHDYILDAWINCRHFYNRK